MAIAELTPLQPVRNLADLQSASTARTNLGLAIGSDVQAYSARLTDIAAITATDSNIIVGNGSTWVAESGATARTSIGLGTTDSVQFSRFAVGGATLTHRGINLVTALSGATGQIGFAGLPIFGSDATATGDVFFSFPFTAAASYTMANLYHFRAVNASKGAGSTITNQIGLSIPDLTSGTSNYGVHSIMTSGTNKLALNLAGTASSYTAGGFSFGNVSAPSAAADRFWLYGSDFAAGNSCPTFLTENGTTIQLNQSLTTTATVLFQKLGIGAAVSAGAAFGIGGSGNTTGASQFAINVESFCDSTATSNNFSWYSRPRFGSGSYTTVTGGSFYLDNPPTMPSGVTVTNLCHLNMQDLTRGTNNYGIISNITAGSGKYGWYGVGTADNLFNGSLILGSSAAPTLSTNQAGLYAIDQAAGNRCIGWSTENGQTGKLYTVATYTPTNVTTDRSYDANATTLDEVADVLGTLIADLKLTGLLA